MYIKKHRSGSGWDYQFAIPRPLQTLFGKTQISGYIRGRQDRAGRRDAQAVAIERARSDAAEIAMIKAILEHERPAYIAKGGLKAIRASAATLEGRIALHRPAESLSGPVRSNEVVGYYVARDGNVPPSDADEHADQVIRNRHADDVRQQREVAALERSRELIAKVDGGKPRNGMRDLHELWTTMPLKKTRRPPEITTKHKASVERFIAIVGDLSVKDITRDQIRQFYAANDRELPDKPKAREKHADHIKALLNLAASVGWRDDNPADKIRISVASTAHDADDKGKKAFTPAQLCAIVEAAKVEWKDNPDAILALRMLIFGGFRSNECCQLRSSDIENKDGVACIRVRKGPGQSVKNKPSRRYVPLHKEIAADVLARSGDGNEFLFPSFPHINPKGHNRWLVSAFNGRKRPDGTGGHQNSDGSVKSAYVGLLRGTCGITDPDLTLHSIRRSFKEACRRARVELETCNELMGHGKGCENEKYSGEMLELMADAIHEVNPLSAALKPRGLA